MEFSAGDIQKILEINKSRYGYLMDKIRIDPEVEKVRGTGRSNKFSYENLLDFAVAHAVGAIGVNPSITRNFLSFLKEEEVYRLLFYEKYVENDFSVQIVFKEKRSFFRLFGKKPENLETRTTRGGFKTKGHDPQKGDYDVQMIDFCEEIDLMSGGLEEVDCYITVNVSAIKKRVNGAIEKLIIEKLIK